MLDASVGEALGTEGCVCGDGKERGRGARAVAVAGDARRLDVGEGRAAV